jgi:hypothetical protein
MFNSGKVVSQSAFMKRGRPPPKRNAQNTKDLPPFAWTYVPDANGAAGGYYPDGNVTPYSTGRDLRIEAALMMKISRNLI